MANGRVLFHQHGNLASFAPPSVGHLGGPRPGSPTIQPGRARRPRRALNAPAGRGDHEERKVALEPLKLRMCCRQVNFFVLRLVSCRLGSEAQPPSSTSAPASRPPRATGNPARDASLKSPLSNSVVSPPKRMRCQQPLTPLNGWRLSAPSMTRLSLLRPGHFLPPSHPLMPSRKWPVSSIKQLG